MCSGPSRGSSHIKALIVAVLLGAVTAAAQERAERYVGRSLAEALQLLQQQGLRIVYSSAVVTGQMRVLAEPRATNARRALEELLRPHGLTARPGPGGVLQVVRVTVAQPGASDRESKGRGTEAGQHTPDQALARPNESPPAYEEAVVVLATAEGRRDLGVASQSDLDRDALRMRSSVLTGDPMSAVHTMPRVAASDDFRGEFSVRGSASRHLGVVIDGVATRYLLHAAYGAGDSSSLAMLNSDVIERATLQAGAHARRFDDRLGGQLVLTLREGSRQRAAVSGTLGGVAASVVAEGPLGRSARGSWLVSGRHSFLDWPTTRFGTEYTGMGFGFRDWQTKVVYDATPTEQVSFTAITGRSLADYGNDAVVGGVFEGAHRATMATLGWRSTLGSRTVVSQRAHVVTHDARNTGPEAERVSESRERELAYRLEVVHGWSRVMLEAAAEVQRANGSLEMREDSLSTSDWQRSGYLHAAWTVARGLTIAPGLRMAHSSLASRSRAAPWILGEWAPASGWTLTASTGLGHQFPGVDDVLGAAVLPRRSGEPMTVAKRDLSRRSSDPITAAKAERHLSPERARYLDVALARAIGGGARVQATLFDRAERDVLDGGRNALAGTSRGVELAVERLATTGLAASASYSFGRTRYTDASTGEEFWADFDQRHAITLFASVKFSRASLAAVFRGGSNLPIAGYLTARDGRLFAGDRRNAVRRPPYARLDVQASRTFSFGGRDVALYVEMLNALNRTNFGPADGVFRTDGEAVGFTEKLLPRFVSGGLRIAF